MGQSITLSRCYRTCLLDSVRSHEVKSARRTHWSKPKSVCHAEDSTSLSPSLIA